MASNSILVCSNSSTVSRTIIGYTCHGTGRGNRAGQDKKGQTGTMSDEEYEYDYGSDYGDMDEDGSPENEIAIEIENSFYEAVGCRLRQ